MQGINFAPVPLYTLLDGDKPDSWARVFHTRFEIDSFVTLNLYLGSKHIVFLVQDMYILNFHLFFGINALLHKRISIFRPTERMFRWFVSILGVLYTNTLRRINVNYTLLGDQLTQFLRANANNMILTFCLAQTLFHIIRKFFSLRFGPPESCLSTTRIEK